ncbi:MAG: hypothetical protein EB059_02005 [Alphaproteobacteria bacterium]|nr:hypothetical protein [Alphaproteobacteria bacterium]
MKTLILLRHAEAVELKNGKDIQRPLTQKGRGMAVWVAHQLSKEERYPEFILCSSALRTKETCQLIQDAWADDCHPQVFFDPAIYSLDVATAMEMISEQDEMHDTIMIIGHNPTIHELAAHLCDVTQAPKKIAKLTHGFPPASCAIIQFDVQDWNKIRKAKGTLVDFFHPTGSH